MGRKKIWLVFVLLIAVVALWFIVKGVLEIGAYYSLSAQAPATIEKWSIKEKHSDSFAVEAEFTFNYKEKSYQGVTNVGGLYPNPWAAGHAQERFSAQKWSAWFNPHKPEKAVLEKKFPLKKTLSTVVLIGLATYFSILGIYLGRKGW